MRTKCRFVLFREAFMVVMVMVIVVVAMVTIVTVSVTMVMAVTMARSRLGLSFFGANWFAGCYQVLLVGRYLVQGLGAVLGKFEKQVGDLVHQKLALGVVRISLIGAWLSGLLAFDNFWFG